MLDDALEVHAAAVRQGKELTVDILGERRDHPVQLTDYLRRVRAADVAQHLNQALIEVGVNVRSLEIRNGATVIDVSPHDGVAPPAVGVIIMEVREERLNQARVVARSGRVLAGAAFENRPAVVAATSDQVDLLKTGVTHIAEPKLPARAVEPETPWVAEPRGPDFRSSATCREWIVRRNAVCGATQGVGAVHVQPQEFAEQAIERLRVRANVPVTHAHHQVTLRIKGEAARVVNWSRHRDLEQDLCVVGGQRRPEPLEPTESERPAGRGRRAGIERVADEEIWNARKVWMECDGHEPELPVPHAC